MSNARKLADNLPTDGQLGNRNLIINGAMEVWQRGTSFAVNGYHADRWSADASNASNFSYDQSTSAPDGFKYSTKIQTTTAFSATSYQFYRYNIEGQDLVQLQLGASGAEKITLSFWVRASQTGNYSIAFTNSANNYAYPTTYTINAANTWEHKTITLDGATAGTWLTTNGVGLRIKWDLGSGGTFDSTTDTWVAADKATVSGSVKLGATVNANLYLTGVQLEVGPQSTPFEHEPYETTLRKCQRYYAKIEGPIHGYACWSYSNVASTHFSLPEKMRTIPSVTLTGTTNLGSNASVGDSTFSLYNHNTWIGTSGSNGVQYGGTSASSTQSIRINAYPHNSFTSNGISVGLYFGQNCSINADSEL